MSETAPMTPEERLQHRLDRSLERQATARTLSLALMDELGRSSAPPHLLELARRLAETLSDTMNFDPETGQAR